MDDGKVWRQSVGEGEEAEAIAKASQGPQSRVDGRVDEELQTYSNDAEDGHGEPDAAGRHPQSAREAKRQRLSRVGRWRRVLRIEAGRGKMDVPEIVEGANVKS